MDNFKDAKVGDTYLEYTTDIKAMKRTYKEATKHGASNEEETEEEILVKHGYKVWIILQPKWTEEDVKREMIRHQKYADIYHNNPEYRGQYEQRPSTQFPHSLFPNGLYETERWKPFIFDDEKEEWLPADMIDCKNWETIPENKKRIHFLYGILPDE